MPIGSAVQTTRESVGATVSKAATMPLVEEGRRSASTRSSMPGEPTTPPVCRVLKAADRPLSTHEVTMAMLKVQEAELPRTRGRRIAKRVLSLLGQVWPCCGGRRTIDTMVPGAVCSLRKLVEAMGGQLDVRVEFLCAGRSIALPTSNTGL